MAAAVRAARLGYRVCLTEENPWIGGQATSQGVAALDEHPHIEHFGGTELYGEFRAGIRAFYRNKYKLKTPTIRTSTLGPVGSLRCALSRELD